MAIKYPQDTIEFQKERKSFQVLFYKLNMDVWVLNGSDNSDHGMDYEFEHVENGEFRGYRLLSQIKSTEHLKEENNVCKFDLKVSTAAYAVSCASPFVLFLADLISDSIYYICLQEYFIRYPERLKKLGINKSTIRIEIPISNLVSRENEDLMEIAKRQYKFDEKKGLRLVDFV